eukprot:6701666-Prymnesium_polylepis.1
MRSVTRSRRRILPAAPSTASSTIAAKPACRWSGGSRCPCVRRGRRWAHMESHCREPAREHPGLHAVRVRPVLLL